MSKSPKKSKSNSKNGSPKKQASTGASPNSAKNGASKNGTSGNGKSNNSANGSNSPRKKKVGSLLKDVVLTSDGGMLYECRKIELGITHEMGTLEFFPGRIVWRSANDTSLKHTIRQKDVKNIEWLNVDKRKKLMKIGFVDKNKPHFRVIGFAGEDEYEIDSLCEKSVGHRLAPKGVCVKGWNWGRFVLRGQEMVCRTEDKHILFTVPYNSINQSVIQAKNELSLEFNPLASKLTNNDKSHAVALNNSDQLMEMRIYIPDDGDSTAANAAYEEFHSLLQKKAKLEQDKSLIIAWFDGINFRMPRGKKQIQFYPNHFIFRSAKNSYKIEYEAIKRLFVFEQPGGDKIAFLVNLRHAVRQGGSEYDCLIMEFPSSEQCSTEINATTDELKNKYCSRDGSQLLEPKMNGATYDILSRVFMALSKIKIITAKSFESSTKDRCVRAVHNANNGLLYPLEKSIFFIWIPAFIKHSDIDHVEFKRFDDSQHVKMFDVAIYLLKRKNKPLIFTGIDKCEYEPLVKYFLNKPSINLADRSLHESRMNQTMSMQSRSTRTRKNITSAIGSGEAVGGIGGLGGDDDDDDDDDEDYDMNADANMLKQDVKLNAQHDAKYEENNGNNNSNDKSNNNNDDDDDEEDEDFDIE